MEKDKGNMNARKRKTKDGGCKLSFRLNAEEKEWFERMMAETEARDRTLLIKKSLFGGTLRVVKTDKATLDYYVRLTDFYRQFQAVGNNYNQTVKAVKKNFDEKRARTLLYRLEKCSLELMLVCKKIVALTQEYERKWLQR